MEEKKKPGIWALVIKLGGKFLSLLIKSTKLLKVGLAAASFAGYAFLWNWRFALLMMVALGFHEMAHVKMAHRLGLKTKGWAYLPFLGAVAILEEGYATYAQNVLVALAGPIGGMLLAWATMAIYWATDNPMWAAAAAFQAILNLFQMIPVVPLDGSQVIRSIAFSINKWMGAVFLLVSLALGAAIMIKLHIGLFALLLLVGGIEVFMEWRYRIRLLNPNVPRWLVPDYVLDHTYPKSMNTRQIILSGLGYVGTIGMLIAIIVLTKHVRGADFVAYFLD